MISAIHTPTCSICFDEINGSRCWEAVHPLRLNNAYRHPCHTKCMNLWLAIQRTCPICSVPLPSIVIQNILGKIFIGDESVLAEIDVLLSTKTEEHINEALRIGAEQNHWDLTMKIWGRVTHRCSRFFMIVQIAVDQAPANLSAKQFLLATKITDLSEIVLTPEFLSASPELVSALLPMGTLTLKERLHAIQIAYEKNRYGIVDKLLDNAPSEERILLYQYADTLKENEHHFTESIKKRGSFSTSDYRTAFEFLIQHPEIFNRENKIVEILTMAKISMALRTKALTIAATENNLIVVLALLSKRISCERPKIIDQLNIHEAFKTPHQRIRNLLLTLFPKLSEAPRLPNTLDCQEALLVASCYSFQPLFLLLLSRSKPLTREKRSEILEIVAKKESIEIIRTLLRSGPVSSESLSKAIRCLYQRDNLEFARELFLSAENPQSLRSSLFLTELGNQNWLFAYWTLQTGNVSEETLSRAIEQVYQHLANPTFNFRLLKAALLDRVSLFSLAALKFRMHQTFATLKLNIGL